MAKKGRLETDEVSRITLRDFRSWLSGVEDMQEEGWTPSSEQWKRIREKIDQIDDTITSVEVPSKAAAIVPAPEGGATKNFPQAAQRTAPPPVVTKSALDVTSVPAPAAKTTIPLAPGPDGRLKTPDVDTSKEGYVRSPFA